MWDLIVEWLKLFPATYLDVGAYHPVRSNNTYFFYERNCQGVLVEPNPALWEILAKVRPRDVLIRGGIGIDGKDSEADYYVISGDGKRAELRTPGNFDITRIVSIDTVAGYAWFMASPDNVTRRYLYRAPSRF